ncbi:MAG: maltotransferase domain-containing protein, partial [Paracoccus sp. (in: a-proteobacteria)]
MGGENALRALARSRIAIEGVSIEIDGGRFSAKVVAGQVTTVEADIFSDGHDSIDAALLYRRVGSDNFSEAP